jgi:hypothetical protein
MTPRIRRVLSRGGRVHRFAGALVVLTALLAVVVRVVPVDATFSGQVGGAYGSLSLTALYAPSGLVATSTSTNVGLTWTGGANGSSYTVLGAPANAQGQCVGVTWSLVGSAATTAYTDTRGGPQGTSYCYLVQTTYAQWSSVLGNPTAVAPLGFVADSVTMQKGGSANRLDPGDKFTVHFSRPVDPATGPATGNTVCATNTGTIVLAATNTSGSCVATEANRLGTLTGGTQNQNVRFNATFAWTDTQTLVVTVGTRRSGSQGTTFAGTWTFTPTKTSTNLLSVTNRTHVCDANAGGSKCLPTATGSL